MLSSCHVTISCIHNMVPIEKFLSAVVQSRDMLPENCTDASFTHYSSLHPQCTSASATLFTLIATELLLPIVIIESIEESLLVSCVTRVCALNLLALAQTLFALLAIEMLPSTIVERMGETQLERTLLVSRITPAVCILTVFVSAQHYI